VKISLPKVRPNRAVVSNVLIVAAMFALVGFGATFGLRWALAAAVVPLILLGMAAGN